MTEEERRRMASPSVPKFPEGQTASVRDWSQNPAVSAAMKTGNVAEIEKATMAARDAFRAGETWAAGAKQVPLNPTPALQQRTPEQQQMLLAQMREQGAGIRSNLEEQSRNRYYSFRQGLEERKAQEAMTPSFGNTVGREATMRGAQATIEAERMRQAQQGRSTMSGEPLKVRGMQFRQAGMGQYAPIRGFGDSWQSNFMGGGGPQPMAGMAQAAPATPSAPSTSAPASTFWQTATSPQAVTGILSGTQFANRITQPEEDRFGGLSTAMGISNRRRTGPLPYGLRS